MGDFKDTVHCLDLSSAKETFVKLMVSQSWRKLVTTHASSVAERVPVPTCSGTIGTQGIGTKSKDVGRRSLSDSLLDLL